MHALIAMTPTDIGQDEELEGAHEEFIGELEAQHRVILGGELAPPVAGHYGAYVIRCDSLDEARAIAARDPLVKRGAVTLTVTEWRLVGVDPEAVDRTSLLFP
jgi:uncharacterized protein YciI